MKRIYLDNAATSWPKPEAVYQAVDRYQRHLGAPAGRGSYREAAEVERLLADARREVANLLDVADSRRIVFTHNGTDSLNMAIHGLLQPGDHVITSVVEHNSVLRPLGDQESRGRIEVTRVPCDSLGVVDPQAFRQAIRPRTRLLVLVHASNVTGALQPVEDVGHIAHENGIPLLLDAAQTLGHLPVAPQACHADLLAAPGHKGLLGPLGSGILYVAPGLDQHLRSTRQGGTGTVSESDRQPETMPDKFEAGNHAVPAIIGLGAGVRFLRDRGLDQVRAHHLHLLSRLLEGFQQIGPLAIHGPADASKQTGVVSVTLPGYDPQEVAAMLDSACGIQVRAGLQCAPRMHQALGTMQHGGTVRFSIGIFNTEDDIEEAIDAVRQLARSLQT